MNRRTLMQRLLAGAAAIVGVGMVAPKAEASELDWPPLVPGAWWQTGGKPPIDLRGTSNATIQGVTFTGGPDQGVYVPSNPLVVMRPDGVERAVVYGNDPAWLHLRAGTFTADEVHAWMQQSGATNIVGPATGEAVVTGPGALRAPGSVIGITRVLEPWSGEERPR